MIKITENMVRAWLKALCRMNVNYYIDFLESWDEMASFEKESAIKSMEEWRVSSIEEFVDWLEECCTPN